MSSVVRKIFLLSVIILPACGTIVGNGIMDPHHSNRSTPGRSGISPSDFLEVLAEYKADRARDCGSYTENNTDDELEYGRICITHADPSCEPSKYLYNRTNPDGTRFVSFVSVAIDSLDPANCLVYVHTVSNEHGNMFYGQEICDEFIPDQIPELACGVGN